MFRTMLSMVVMALVFTGCGKAETSDRNSLLSNQEGQNQNCQEMECEPSNDTDLCEDLDETACVAQAECIAEYEASGSFEECEDICDDLDERTCSTTEGCEWTCDDDEDDDEDDDDDDGDEDDDLNDDDD